MNDAKRVVAVMETGDGSTELRELFSLVDADKSGSVTSEEWASGVANNTELCAKLFGSTRSKDNLIRVFKRLLPAKGADNGMTWEDFEMGVGSLRVSLAMGVAMSTQEGEQMLRQLFDTLDKDNNSSVDVSEWSRYAALPLSHFSSHLISHSPCLSSLSARSSRGVEENRVTVAKLPVP